MRRSFAPRSCRRKLCRHATLAGPPLAGASFPFSRSPSPPSPGWGGGPLFLSRAPPGGSALAASIPSLSPSLFPPPSALPFRLCPGGRERREGQGRGKWEVQGRTQGKQEGKGSKGRREGQRRASGEGRREGEDGRGGQKGRAKGKRRTEGQKGRRGKGKVGRAGSFCASPLPQPCRFPACPSQAPALLWLLPPALPLCPALSCMPSYCRL